MGVSVRQNQLNPSPDKCSIDNWQANPIEQLSGLVAAFVHNLLPEESVSQIATLFVAALNRLEQ